MTDILTEVVAFEDMSKKDQATHLRTAHNLNPEATWGSKYTKARMESWHRRQHQGRDELVRLLGSQILDNEGKIVYETARTAFSSLSWEARQDYARSYGNDFPVLAVPHTHLPSGFETEMDQVDDAIRASVKRGDNTPVATLNAAQRAALKAVVDNDFNSIDNEIRDMANAKLTEARKEIEERWAAAEEEAKAFAKKINRKYAKAIKKLREEVEEKRIDGVTFPHLRHYDLSVTWTVDNKAAELRKVTDEIESMKREALNASNRQRLIAHRTILLTGVSEEASIKVLGSIPSAATMISQSARTLQLAAKPKAEETEE